MMLKNRNHDRTVSRRGSPSRGGTGDTRPSDAMRIDAIHSGVVSRHTRGLVRFVGDKLVLAVDPAKYGKGVK